MQLSAQDHRAIGQSGYWSRFAVYMVGVPALLVFGVYSLATRDFGMGVLAIIAILPLAIWFRFVMMRRCRDIGWPTWLPWSAQALQILMGFMILSSGAMSGGIAALRTVSSGSMLIGFADFVLVIALGCIASQQAVDYDEIFGGDPVRRPNTAEAVVTYREMPLEDERDEVRRREELAIARAVEAYRNGSAMVPIPATPPAAAPQRMAVPQGLAPRVAGFGRKGL